MLRNFRRSTILALALLFLLAISAQPLASQAHSSEPAKATEAKGEASETKPASGEVKDEHAQFKESPSVKAIGRAFGLQPKQAYWLSVIFNFLVVLFLIWFFSKTGVPKMFRDRSAAIQRGMEEARKASAESAARLTAIEARLASLNQDIANMRTQAEREAKAEEDRLRATTEEEKRKIVQSAEQEIAAASSNARRELKNLAAELAVALAEKKIAVSEETDKMLVREFASGIASSDVKGRG